MGIPRTRGAFFLPPGPLRKHIVRGNDFVKKFRIFEGRESLKIHRQHLWLQIRCSREVKIRSFLCEKSKSLRFFSETSEKAGQISNFLCTEKDEKVKAS